MTRATPAATSGGAEPTGPPATPLTSAGPAMVTAAEEGIWLGQQLDPTSPAFNTAEHIALRGRLDEERLVAAIEAVIRAPATLHRRFLTGDDGRPRWEPAEHRCEVEVLDGRTEPDPAAWADQWMRAAAAAPLAIAEGELFRVALLRTGEAAWSWYLQIHHIAADGHAAMQLIGRIAEHYRTGAAPMVGLDDAALAQLAAADAAYRAGPDRDADGQHWRDLLADLQPAGLSPATALSAPTAIRRTTTSKAASRVTAAARAVGVTWGELVLAGIAAYLTRLTGAPRVALGVPVMNRFGSAARVPATVMNLVPVVVEVPGSARLADLAAQIATQGRAGRRHHRYRHEDLRRDLGRYGPGARLFSVTVNLMPIDPTPDLGPGLHAELHNVVAGPVEDVTIDVRVRRGAWVLTVDANSDVYSPAEVDRHLARLVHLLDGLSDAMATGSTVDRLDLLPPAERDQVLHRWNATEHPVDPNRSLVDLVDDGLGRCPDAVAIVDGERHVTFGDLDRWSTGIAGALADGGVGPGQVVAVGLPRSAALIAAVWGVLRAGAAYLPLELDYPVARLEHVLGDARPAVAIIAPEGSRPTLPAGTRRWSTVPTLADLDSRAGTDATARDAPILPRPAATDLAYVLYTSGSTGRPKGVAVSHRAIANRLLWKIDHLALTPADRIVHKTPIGFDVSVWELVLPAIAGCRQIIARPGGHQDPTYLAELLAAEEATVVHFVPSMLRALLGALDPATLTRAGVALRAIVCSGEALPSELAERFFTTLGHRGAELHNLYGPTEAAIDVTAHRVTPADVATGVVPIGRPVWNTRTYVLDAALQPVPVGVAGDLHLGGVQLAEGYVGRPELTAERFVADPHRPGHRIYRTGDRARWRHDGTIEFLGRDDDQVKLRGQRIELGEIEAVLARHAAVRAVCVLLREDRPGDQRLAAYVVAAGSGADAEALRAWAAAELPAYMVPSAIVWMDALPLSPNGKLDRAALPPPAAPPPDAGQVSGVPDTGPQSHAPRLPGTPREELVCREFARVLDVPAAGLDHGFFELGGHSLLAIELTARLTRALGREVPVTALFRAPTPRQLLHALDGGDLDPVAGLEPVLPLRTGRAGPPLWCVHPAGGLAWCYTGLAHVVDREVPILGLQADGLTGPPLDTIDAMAAVYVDRIRARQPRGPYCLLGWSVGGVIAHAAAALLTDAGDAVGLLALLDCYPSEQWADVPDPDHELALLALLHIAGIDPTRLGRAPLTIDGVVDQLRAAGSALAQLGAATLEAIVATVLASSRAMKRHVHRPVLADVLFFHATAPRDETWLDPAGWRRHVIGDIEVHELACSHPAMVQPVWLHQIGTALDARLRTIARPAQAGLSRGP